MDDERRRPGREMRRLAGGRAQCLERRRQRRFHRCAIRRTLEEDLGEWLVAATARQLEMAEAGPAEDLRLGRIVGEGLLQRGADTLAVAAPRHRDEIDDDGAGEVAQADLPRRALG